MAANSPADFRPPHAKASNFGLSRTPPVSARTKAALRPRFPTRRGSAVANCPKWRPHSGCCGGGRRTPPSGRAGWSAGEWRLRWPDSAGRVLVCRCGVRAAARLRVRAPAIVCARAGRFVGVRGSVRGSGRAAAGQLGGKRRRTRAVCPERPTRRAQCTGAAGCKRPAWALRAPSAALNPRAQSSAASHCTAPRLSGPRERAPASQLASWLAE